MKSRYLDRLAELPGPVWVFGAYVVCRLGEWGFGLLMRVLGGSFGVSWHSAGSVLIAALAVARLAVLAAVLWGLLCRSPYGLSLARWYAGLQAVVRLVALLSLLFSDYDPNLYGCTEHYVEGIAGYVVGCALWLLFLRYLELSEDLAAVMPAGRRNVPWWGVVVLVSLVLFGA